MFQPTSGLLSSLFSPRSRVKRFGRKAKSPRPQRFGRLSAIEELEARRLLVSRVFLDFGDSFGMCHCHRPLFRLQASMPNLRPTILHDNLVGTGIATRNMFQEFFGVIRDNLTVTPPYNLRQPWHDDQFNFNPTPVPTDALTLELAITSQIQQALEPFDIQVVSSAESNFFNFPAQDPPAPIGRLSAMQPG